MSNSSQLTPCALFQRLTMLLVIGISCAVAHAAPRPEPVPIEYFGLHIHRAAAGTAWPNVPFGSWRLWDAYVGWKQLEPNRDQWDFSRLDKYIAMATLTKKEVLLPLALTPAWASARPYEPSGYGPGNAAEPALIADWRNYVETVGRRYRGRIKLFEIWNEPNAKDHYTGSIQKLVELTCEAKKILKSIDSENRVISPAVVGATNIQYLNSFLAAGGKDCIDVIGYHLYVQRQSPEAIVPIIRNVRMVMQRHGLHNLPLWNTETGWWLANGDGTPDHQMVARGGWKKLALDTESGDYLVRALLLAKAEGVDRFYWYSWDNRYGLGMIEPTTGKPKPITDKWRSLTESLVGATGLKCEHSLQDWRCSYVHQDGTNRQVSWSAD